MAAEPAIEQLAPSGVVTTAAPADSAPPLLVLMDVSDSMSELDASGATRIDGAKDAVGDFIESLPTTVRVGLNTYPEDGDCGAGRSDIPISDASLGSMYARVQGLSPSGNTPTGLALRKAGETLAAAGGGSGVIILVSDGESNCEGTSPPPCEVAAELAAEGIDVTVNTVGFQITDAGRDELQCIADSTGGTYVDVEDGKQLEEEFTSHSLPELSLAVTPTDGTVTLSPGAENLVTLAATVRNTGQVEARNVQATIAYDVRFSPGSAKPRVRLGNLAPGSEVSFTWQFRPTDEFLDQSVSYRAVALARSIAEPPAVEGTIRFLAEGDTALVPDWLADADHLVVMGDSYSSGEGTGTAPPSEGPAFDEPTDEFSNTCHRSNAHHYGGVLATLVGTSPKVSTIACSGAVVGDFLFDSKTWNGSRGSDTYQHADGTRSGPPLPSQLDQLDQLDRGPDVVLLTVGGNDARFAPIATRCLVVPSCEDSPLLGAARPQLDEELARLPAKLDLVYREVHDHARKPSGEVVPILVPAYPLPFPIVETGPCRGRVEAEVGGVTVQVLPVENRRFLNHMAAEVNRVVETSVERARKAGIPIWFIDSTATAFQHGHTYCDADPWINRVDAEGLAAKAADVLDDVTTKGWLAYLARMAEAAGLRQPPFLAANNMIHPTRAGYRAEAELILTWARKHQTLPTVGGQVDVAYPPSASYAAAPIELGSPGSATVAPGSSWTATAGGFAPGSLVSVSLASEPERVASTTADAAGRIGVAFTVRADFPIGSHHLVVQGVDRLGDARTLRRPITVARPMPWWWWPAVGAAVVSGAAACTGWVVLASGRRRRRRSWSPTVSDGTEPGQPEQA